MILFFTLVVVMLGLGMVLMPGLGGWLAGESLVMPFFFGAGTSNLAKSKKVVYLN